MRKFVPVFLLFSLCLVIASSVQAQTRPRRVGQTPETSPTTTAPAPQEAPQRRPPVMGGNVGNNQPRPQQQPAPVDLGPEEVEDGDVVRVETALVTIPVTVSDRNGLYIPNLRQQDFRIFEDGTEQQVAYFASVEKPFTVALVLDVSGSTKSRMDEIQDAAIAFVDQLRPEDQVMIVSFDEKVHVLAEATSDRRVLRNAISRASTGDGTSLYDAVDFVIHQRFNRINGRKAIVLFTDGVDTTSRRATYQTNIHDAEEMDALIYPVQYDTFSDMNGPSAPQNIPRRQRRKVGIMEIIIGIATGGDVLGGGGGSGGGGNSGTSRADYERADNYLGELAQRTGARRYRADTTRNIEESFALIAEELRRQYSLGYYPQAVAQDGQRRQIKVRVNHPNMIVRARDSYISNSAPDNINARGGQQQQEQRRSQPERPRIQPRELRAGTSFPANK
ncbi:MAG: VWA domain-containing protein [Pyrinomonadaceae bacterium]|nr:VWA domain-containing protein [Pyrinomonadaceae bacterium]